MSLIAEPDSCLNKSNASEPVFLLCARDPFAPAAVEAWAGMSTGFQPAEKIAEARRIAAAMRGWSRTAA